MGRIRTTWIKTFSKELIEKYPQKVSEKFEDNKKFLKEVGLLEDKVVRNKVAGYSAKLKKKSKKAI